MWPQHLRALLILETQQMVSAGINQFLKGNALATLGVMLSEQIGHGEGKGAVRGGPVPVFVGEFVFPASFQDHGKIGAMMVPFLANNVVSFSRKSSQLIGSSQPVEGLRFTQVQLDFFVLI